MITKKQDKSRAGKPPGFPLQRYKENGKPPNRLRKFKEFKEIYKQFIPRLFPALYAQEMGRVGKL